MNKEKRQYQRSSSIGTLNSSQMVASLLKQLQEKDAKIKCLQGYVTSLIVKIQEKDNEIEVIQRKYQQLSKDNQKHLQRSTNNIISNPETTFNSLVESILDVTNLDQNELNIKNRMESMKTFEINKMPTLFQRNMRRNSSYERIPRVVSHSRILQLRPGNIKVTQPVSPVGVISISQHLKLKQRNEPENYLKLFESFLVVTGDISQLGNSQTLNPKIIYSYPNKITTDKQKTIPLFCFPNKIQCNMIERQEKSEQKVETNVFILNSEYTTSNKSNKIISSINPNHYFYGICLTTTFNVKMGVVFYKVPITYVILTYFPFFNFFFQILSSTIKISKPYQNSLVNEHNIQDSLQELKQLKINSFPITLRYKSVNKTHTFSIPQSHFIDTLILPYCNHSIQLLNAQIISNILIFLLLQYSIVLYSKNSSLLSQVITFFIQIIKPLKYPYPIIVNLPSQMQPMLDSPFPCLLGITSQLTSPLSQSHVFFNLDSKQIITQVQLPKLHYVFDYLKNSIKHKFTNYNELVKKIKYIIKEDILNNTKQKHSMMTPFLQKFRMTQIYKYNYQ